MSGTCQKLGAGAKIHENQARGWQQNMNIEDKISYFVGYAAMILILLFMAFGMFKMCQQWDCIQTHTPEQCGLDRQ